MAARENQGYLIAVIILTLLVLVLALASFFGISKANEYSASSEDLQVQLKGAKNLATAQEIKANVLMAYVGDLGPDASTVGTQLERLDGLKSGVSDNASKLIEDVKKEINDVITKAYNEDNPDAADKGFTWRGYARDLSSVVARKHNDLNIKDNSIKTAKRENEANIQAKVAEVTKIRESLTKAQQDLELVRADAMQKEQTWNQERQNQNTEFQKLVAREKANGEAHQIALRKLQQENAKLAEDNVTLSDLVATYTRVNFDLPDGEIVRVSAPIKLVHVNIGSSDGLRANRTFAVFSRDVNNFQKDQHKATIEITKINGPHQAEARITMEDPTNPIERGDKIISPTWDPGYSVPIALVGVFDTDYDGNSDTQRLIQQIERNGGTVVAYSDEAGNIIGEIDADTRFAVQGTEPPIDTPQQVFKAIRLLTDQAEDNHVQTIGVRKLMNWMGEHGQARVERLDSNTGGEFRRRAPNSTLKDSNR